MHKENLTEIIFDDENNNAIDPFDLFEEWYKTAEKNENKYANALSFATVDKEGRPDNRILLMNGRDRRGFIVYMNLNSAKGEQLKNNPNVAAVFYWKSINRQIRIRGYVELVSDKEADDYFATRPRGSQIGAHASDQSKILKSRAQLLEKNEQIAKKYANKPVPRPQYWSGFRIIPLEMEFWKDGKFRLHDRILFKRTNINTPFNAIRLNP